MEWKLIFPDEEKQRLQDMEAKRKEMLGNRYVPQPIPVIPAHLKTWHCPILQATDDPRSKSTLSFTLLRRDTHGHELLVPGEHYLFSTLLRADGMQSTSSYFVTYHAGNTRPISLLSGSASTSPTFASPGGFQRIGACPVTLPTDLADSFTIDIGICGPGKVMLQDLQFFNAEAVEGLYAGRSMVRGSHREQLAHGEYNFTVVKPDNMFSLAGLNYLVHGFIPLRQWVQPMLAWALLVFALFLGILGFNVLMRRQWAEHERFTFPMNIIPRQLFGGDTPGVASFLATSWCGGASASCCCWRCSKG